MSFFQQSTFRTMFSNDTNSRPQNSRSNKIPKIDIDLDPIKMFSSIFSPKSNQPNIRSCCESCSAKFNLIRPKKICDSCKFEFCSSCFRLETDLGTTRSTICLKCRIFSNRPLKKEDLNKLKVKDLKWFLRCHRISSSLCREKSDLVDLIIQHFGLRIPNQNTNNVNQTGAGPSRTSSSNGLSGNNTFTQRNETDDVSSTNSSQNTSPLRSAMSNNLNSDSNSNESTLGSDWEFVNERFSSINTSNNQTPTNEFVNITVNTEARRDLNSGTNSNSQNETTLNSNDPISVTTDNNRSNDNLINNNSTTATNAANSRPDENDTFTNSETNTSRLHNANLNNLNTINLDENLSTSTESLTGFKNFNINDCSSENEIKGLTVRQLKLVLTRNYVNYKGCCEKDELQEKAIRLWKQINQDRDLINDEKDEDLCKICMENIINCVLLECGHLVSCLDCGKRLNECPICRQYVVRAIRTFKS